MIIIRIDNEYCNSLEQLKKYFSQELNVGSNIYSDLLSYGRDGDIAEWLRELGEENLANKVNSIEDNGDADFLKKLGRVITDENITNNISKRPFNQCFDYQNTEWYVDGDKIMVKVTLKILMVANETYKVSVDNCVDNCFEHVEQVINPSKYEEGNNVPLSFVMHKPFGKITVEVEGYVLYEGGLKELITVNGVSFEMVYVEGGTFSMGATSEQGSDAYSYEKPVHSVTLSDYYIGETEVTQELWQAVMGSNPSYFKGNNQRPVENVSWNDCQKFIEKLNYLTGKKFRLPTEAEWEYAAREGKYCKDYVYKYSGSNNPDEVAWYYGNSKSKTHPVKTKKANKLGLYDMNGNVWEWCNDRYGGYQSYSQTNPTGPSTGEGRVLRGGSWGNVWEWYNDRYGGYQSYSQTNPTGPSTGGYRVLRGGSWNYGGRYVRVSNRCGNTPDYRSYDGGLRLAL